MSRLAWSIILFFGISLFPFFAYAEEINTGGWPIPDLVGLTPYSITIKMVDGVEKITELFDTPSGGNVAKISGNGRIYAYAVDHDHDPPIDYLIIDREGSGKFTVKLGPKESYTIPEWVSQ